MKQPARSGFALLAALTACLAANVTDAFAHAADRGFVMLLPTGYYLFGGAAAVALSFTILAVLPPEPLESLLRRRLPLASLRLDFRLATSSVSFAVIVLLWLSGLFGSRDPLSNPLPLVFWTVFWIGFTLLVGLCGNLWRWLEPWYGPSRLILLAIGRAGKAPPFELPNRIGHAGAIVLLFGFGWFELIFPSPDDPEILAWVLIGYWLFNMAGILAFGHAAWTQRVELFSVFFGMLARLAVLDRKTAEPGPPPPPRSAWSPSPVNGGGSRLRPAAASAPPLRSGGGGPPQAVEGAAQPLSPVSRQARLWLRFPGGKLDDAGPLPPSGVAFLLLALATVSFDGLMRTFFWLGLIGVNPLEFPGRSAVVLPNSIGLLVMFAALAAIFAIAVWLGATLAHLSQPVTEIAGLLVWSIVPIALAYHFSHYLGALVVNGQYALAAISDPFSNGWNLFGTAGYHIAAGATAGYEAAWIIWNLQSAAIIGGHLLAVILAHALAFRIAGNARTAAISQVPLAILMVGYTVFGLWLLSSPTGG